MDTRTGKRRPGQDVRPENVWSRSIFRAAGNILKFLAATRAARTPQDIDAAAQLFARACAQLSIATLITILTRGAAKIAARPGFRQRQKSGGGAEKRIDEKEKGTPREKLTKNDFHDINTKVSQKQNRHIAGRPEYRGGGTMASKADAQKVLDAYHSQKAQILGKNSQGFPIVKYDGVTGLHYSPGAGYFNQPTNAFVIKGTTSPSVVPITPNWTPI